VLAATVRSPASAVEAATNDPRCPFAEAQAVDERRAQNQAPSQPGQPAAEVPPAQDERAAPDSRRHYRSAISNDVSVAQIELSAKASASPGPSQTESSLIPIATAGMTIAVTISPRPSWPPNSPTESAARRSR
jgi:hypothetical protein